jgi:hypothetical protein
VLRWLRTRSSCTSRGASERTKPGALLSPACPAENGSATAALACALCHGRRLDLLVVVVELVVELLVELVVELVGVVQDRLVVVVVVLSVAHALCCLGRRALCLGRHADVLVVVLLVVVVVAVEDQNRRGNPSLC